jgi:hypothetical protein
LWPALAAFGRDARGTLEVTADWPDGPAVLRIQGLHVSTDYGPVGPIDGTIQLDRLLPPRTAEPQHLRIEGLRLAELARWFEIEALGAEGTIDADLRFSLTEEGRLFVEEGLLTARGPGLLRYRPDRPPAALAGQGQGVELLFTATLRLPLRGLERYAQRISRRRDDRGAPAPRCQSRALRGPPH